MFKKVFKHFLIAALSLYVITNFVSGLVFEEGIKTIALTGAAITGAHYVVRPIINLLLIPLNLITFNLFKWVSSAIVLYLVTLVVPGFRIEGFLFGGLSNQWISIPELNFHGVLAYVGFSIIISLLTSIIFWFIKS